MLSEAINTAEPTIEQTLLYGVDASRCGRCHDLGLWLQPTGVIAVCPRLMMGEAHNTPNAAAEMVKRAGRLLEHKQIVANPHAFSVAKALTRYSHIEPCNRQKLIDSYFTWSPEYANTRELHRVIEELRSVWFLPVASRKKVPHGYWIATSQDEFEEWFRECTSAPRTQLKTIFRLAKANWPVYGEQIEMDFWKDMTVEPEAEVTDIAA